MVQDPGATALRSNKSNVESIRLVTILFTNRSDWCGALDGGGLSGCGGAQWVGAQARELWGRMVQ